MSCSPSVHVARVRRRPDATRTVYPVIWEPPLFTGAVHDICIEVRYPVATGLVGGSGTVGAGGGTRVDGRYFCVVAETGSAGAVT